MAPRYNSANGNGAAQGNSQAEGALSQDSSTARKSALNAGIERSRVNIESDRKKMKELAAKQAAEHQQRRLDTAATDYKSVVAQRREATHSNAAAQQKHLNTLTTIQDDRRSRALQGGKPYDQQAYRGGTGSTYINQDGRKTDRADTSEAHSLLSGRPLGEQSSQDSSRSTSAARKQTLKQALAAGITEEMYKAWMIEQGMTPNEYRLLNDGKALYGPGQTKETIIAAANRARTQQSPAPSTPSAPATALTDSPPAVPAVTAQQNQPKNTVELSEDVERTRAAYRRAVTTNKRNQSSYFDTLTDGENQRRARNLGHHTPYNERRFAGGTGTHFVDGSGTVRERIDTSEARMAMRGQPVGQNRTRGEWLNVPEGVTQRYEGRTHTSQRTSASPGIVPGSQPDLTREQAIKSNMSSNDYRIATGGKALYPHNQSSQQTTSTAGRRRGGGSQAA